MLDHKLLKKSVYRIVAEGDLNVLTSKMVRSELEPLFPGVPLKEHKSQIEAVVLKAIAKMQQSAEEEESENSGQGTKRKEESGQVAKASKGAAAQPSAEEQRLRKVIAACGLQGKTRFKGIKDMDEEEVVSRLRSVLTGALGTHKPSRQEVEAYKAKRELELELDGIDRTNIINDSRAQGRPRRAAAQENLFCAYTVDENEEDDNDEDDEGHGRAAPSRAATAPHAPRSTAAASAPRLKRVLPDDDDDDELQSEDGAQVGRSTATGRQAAPASSADVSDVSSPEEEDDEDA